MLCLIILLISTPLVVAIDFTTVQLWRCIPTSPTQSWSLNTTNQPPGSSRITLNHPTSTNNVWDLNGPSNKSGTAIHLFHAYSNPAQSWHYSNTSGVISSPTYARGMCATALYPVGGAPLALEKCGSGGGSSTLQAFTFDQGTGAFHLQADPTLCIDAGSFTNCSLPPTSTFPFCDTSATPEARAADLAGRMETSELAYFLGNGNAGVPSLGVPKLGYGEALHGLLRECLPTPVTNSTGCPTSFPHLLLLSGTLNRTLWHSIAHAIGDEGRAYFNLANRSSHLISWAPDINPFRDPRWGRGQEVAGEDPTLLADFIAQYAKGMQEDDPRFIKFVSTGKHFSLYDFENGTDANGVYYIRQNFTAVSTLQLATSYYWPPFLSAVQNGGVKSIMCSYQNVCIGGDCDPAKINHTGIPSCANGGLQNGMLRGDWGWKDGFIVSDCDAVGNIFEPHQYTPTAMGAAAAAMLAGTDVDCGSTYANNLGAAVEAGLLPKAPLVTAATRVLTVAFALGLYNPIGTTPYDSIPPTRLDSADNRALALEGAIQGMVLLQNNNSGGGGGGGGSKPLLPLHLPSLQRVAIIGPLANATQTLLSNYEGGNTLVNSHSILQALTARFGAAPAPAPTLTYAPGCVNSTGGTTVWCGERTGFPAAVAAAQGANVAIVVVGLCSTCPLDGWRLEGEGHDRSVLTLPGEQEALVAAVAGTGVPVVVVLVHGGPLAIEGIKATIPAILDAHYPGELGGDAVAAVLLGDVSPSGRLTTTYYPAGIVAARPSTDMNIAPHGNGIPGLTHLFVPEADTLWPFGWGMSYANFDFAWAPAAVGSSGSSGSSGNNSSSSSTGSSSTGSSSTGSTGSSSTGMGLGSSSTGSSSTGMGLGTFTTTTQDLLTTPPTYTLHVRNTGGMTSSLSVLGMLSSLHPSRPGEPLQELFDFDRVGDVGVGEGALITLRIPAGVAASVGEDGVRVVRPGVYVVRVGEPGNWVVGSLEITGPPLAITPAQAARLVPRTPPVLLGKQGV